MIIHRVTLSDLKGHIHINRDWSDIFLIIPWNSPKYENIDPRNENLLALNVSSDANECGYYPAHIKQYPNPSNQHQTVVEYMVSSDAKGPSSSLKSYHNINTGIDTICVPTVIKNVCAEGTKEQTDALNGQIMNDPEMTLSSNYNHKRRLDGSYHTSPSKRRRIDRAEFIDDENRSFEEEKTLATAKKLKVNDLQTQFAVQQMLQCHKIEEMKQQIYKQQCQIQEQQKQLTIYKKIGRDRETMYQKMMEQWSYAYKQNQKMKYEMGIVTKWKWKDINGTWIPYNNSICQMLNTLRIGVLHEFTFDDNKVRYFIKETAENGMECDINMDTSKEIKKFDTKYPSWWETSKTDFDLNVMAMDPTYSKPQLPSLKMDENPAKPAINRFKKTCPNAQIIQVKSVENKMLYDSYMYEKTKMIKSIGKDKINERLLFHGTKKLEVMGKIQKEGFRKEFNSKFAHGQGTYFARDASYSYKANGGYCCEKDGVYQMFICLVLLGESCIGHPGHTLTKWPIKDGGKGLIYDSLVNKEGSIFVIHENMRAYPMFVIHFK